jgi:hypothetical protein
MPRSRRRRMAAAVQGGALPAVSAPTVNTERGYTALNMGQSAYGAIWNNRVENPDEVLKQLGSWEGLAFYARMLRQFPFLVGICMQWISQINAIDRAITAGDPENDTSLRMAEDARRLYARINGKEIINQHLLWGRFYGFSAVEKVWELDAQTGLLAPLKLYDIDPWNFRFGPNEEVYVLDAKNPTEGTLVTDPRRFMFFRWGSNFTGYGKGDLRYVYLPTWYIQQVLRFGLQAIERFGRPIPHVSYPGTFSKPEVDELEARLVAQFKNYLLTQGTDATVRVEFPAQNILANGAAGKSEVEFVRFMEGWCYIALNLTQQTQDKTSGSRALESVRQDISGDLTPPGSQALDTVWTRYWLDEIGEVNWPNQPRNLWPRFNSDTSEVANAGLNGAQATAVINIGTMLATNGITPGYAEEALAAIGIPRHKATAMVQSTVKDRESLTPAIPNTVPAAPAPDPFEGSEENEDDESD